MFKERALNDQMEHNRKNKHDAFSQTTEEHEVRLNFSSPQFNQQERNVSASENANQILQALQDDPEAEVPIELLMPRSPDDSKDNVSPRRELNHFSFSGNFGEESNAIFKDKQPQLPLFSNSEYSTNKVAQ
jgi:hypothetical protein